MKWNTETTPITWEYKKDFSNTYVLVENITEKLQRTLGEVKPTTTHPSDANTSETKTMWVQCYVCKGMGTVPDKNSTTGTKLCPCCMGSKMIPQYIEAIQK